MIEQGGKRFMDVTGIDAIAKRGFEVLGSEASPESTTSVAQVCSLEQDGDHRADLQEPCTSFGTEVTS